MKAYYTDRPLRSYGQAPLPVRKAFDKQVQLLLSNIRHPSLRAKKYDERRKRWIDPLISTREASSLIVCETVVAEIAPPFRKLGDLEAKLESLGIDFDPIRPESAFMAGEIFRDYRRRGGPRTQLIPDFLIGAHALNQTDCLAAQDRGYFRAYLPGLRIVRPEKQGDPSA